MKKFLLSTILIFAMSPLIFAQDCQGDQDYIYGCGDGPDGCNATIESFVVNVPRDTDGTPLSPFVYTIPNNPTDGQFRVIVRYRTRAGSGAEADGVDFNGVTGTAIPITYGTNTNWADNFEAIFTSGDIANITLDIDSDPVQADNLPGLEVIVFKCSDEATNGTYSNITSNDRAWVNAPGIGSNPYCMSKTLCLPANGCTDTRQLTLTTTIFNIHQDHPCDRELAFEYVPDSGAANYFVEVPPADNSQVIHEINVDTDATEVLINVCTWNANANPNSNWETTCDRGVSNIWGNTIIFDDCSCSANAPNCPTTKCLPVTVIPQ